MFEWEKWTSRECNKGGALRNGNSILNIMELLKRIESSQSHSGWAMCLTKAAYEGHGELSESFEFEPDECRKIQEETKV